MADKKKKPSIEDNLSRFADSGMARNSSVIPQMDGIDATPSRRNTRNGYRTRKDEVRINDKPRFRS